MLFSIVVANKFQGRGERHKATVTKMGEGGAKSEALCIITSVDGVDVGLMPILHYYCQHTLSWPTRHG